MSTENFNQSPGKRPITFCRGQTHWLSKAEFESVKASGMFGEFYPDQPDRWEDLPETEAPTTPADPATLCTALANLISFCESKLSVTDLPWGANDTGHTLVQARNALEAWSRPAPPTPAPPAPMQRLFPAVAAHLQRMTKNGLTGTLLEWDSFLSDLNAALLGNEIKAAVDALAQACGFPKSDNYVQMLETIGKRERRLTKANTDLRKQVTEFEKLFGLDTPWPAVALYKALVIAESKFREQGRDFDGWESIQSAAAVAQQRVSDFLKE